MTRRLLSQAQCDRLRRLCDVHSMKTAARIVGVSPGAVADARSRAWLAAGHRRKLRPRPSDFAIQCGAMTLKALCIHYRAGDEAVRRWAREVGRKPLRPLNRTPPRTIPEDIAAIVAELGPYGAARHYGVSYGTMKSWRKRCGLPVSWSRQPVARQGRSAPSPSQIGWVDRLSQGARGGGGS